MQAQSELGSFGQEAADVRILAPWYAVAVHKQPPWMWIGSKCLGEYWQLTQSDSKLDLILDADIGGTTGGRRVRFPLEALLLLAVAMVVKPLIFLQHQSRVDPGVR